MLGVRAAYPGLVATLRDARIQLEPRFVNIGSTTVVGNADAPCSATMNAIDWRDLD